MLCLEQSERNGYNYETTPIYSELVVDEFEIEGVYYISYGEHELAKDYERAKKVADERGLPLIERDISKYRAEHGLEPMTDKAKMNLCRNILWKCCAGDRELEQAYSQFANGFIKSNFKDFYEKFMQLKENPEFSKEDILRAFADVTRGDIDFGRISQNIDEMYLSEEQKETIQAMKEYGLTDVQDVQTLQQRLEKCISDGIFYGADQQNPEKMKRFETIKKAIPQYEELKTVYLQLRQAGLEDELYKGIDLNNINYSELLERATKILEEKAKADEIKPDISDESVIVTGKEESIIQPSEETTAEVQEVAGGGARINEFGEIIRENNTGESVMQDVPVFEEITPSKTTSKQLEQSQKIQEAQTTNMWKNRFQNWYSSLDRVSQNSRSKFLKMKADIVKAISDKIKVRGNNRNIDNQEKDI